MNQEDVKIGHYYRLNIPSELSWHKNDPEVFKNRWAKFSPTSNEIIKAIKKHPKYLQTQLSRMLLTCR